MKKTAEDYLGETKQLLLFLLTLTMLNVKQRR